MSAFSSLFKKNKPVGDKSPDVEEDGFVVVGETADEKSILTPSNPEYHKDLPPTYQSYQSKSQAAKENEYKMPPVPEQVNQYDEKKSKAVVTSKERSCIEDIPFHFAPSVDPALNFGKLNIDIGDLSTELNSSNYDYDFKTELEVLRNMS